MSAGSSLPTGQPLPDYRTTAGWAEQFPALAKRGLEYKDMANPTQFERNPSLAWGFYFTRMEMYSSCIPHAGYTALLKLVEAKPGGHFVFTSNVDVRVAHLMF